MRRAFFILACVLGAACGSTTDGSGEPTTNANPTSPPSESAPGSSTHDEPRDASGAHEEPTIDGGSPSSSTDAGADAGPQLGACLDACETAVDAPCHARCIDACNSGRCTLDPFDFASVTKVTCGVAGAASTETVSFQSSKKLRACFGPF